VFVVGRGIRSCQADAVEIATGRAHVLEKSASLIAKKVGENCELHAPILG
jgi:hypothetical protein